jgi:hypothetical protein
MVLEYKGGRVLLPSSQSPITCVLVVDSCSIKKGMSAHFHVEGSPKFCHLVIIANFVGTWKCALDS